MDTQEIIHLHNIAALLIAAIGVWWLVRQIIQYSRKQIDRQIEQQTRQIGKADRNKIDRKEINKQDRKEIDTTKRKRASAEGMSG